MKTKLLQFTFLITALFFVSALSLHAQDLRVLTLTNESLANDRKIALDENWKYQFGDEAEWANPQFDDAGWMNLKDADYADWRGIMWARLHLNVAPELAGIPLNLEMQHLGASEIYLDGKLIGGYGKVGRTLAEEQVYNPNYVPLPITFNESGEHLLAVRYSNQTAADVHSVLGAFVKNFPLNGIGFQANLTRFGDSTNVHGIFGTAFGYRFFQLATCLAFGILHLLLFAFYRKQPGNLYYGLFLLSLAGLNFNAYLLGFVHHSTIYAELLAWALTTLLLPGRWLLLLTFLYAVFEGRISRRLWFFAIAFSISTLLRFIPSDTFSALANLTYLLLSLSAAVEASRIAIAAWRKQIDGAWIVALGVVTRGLIVVQDGVSGLVPNMQVSENISTFFDIIGTYGLIASLTIYLARDFARTNINLEAQLVKEIEQERATAILRAENERRAKELEEARALQLSMLPKKLPQIPNLEIAAYMKTATEVGGDYYDFYVGKDGTLTVAVGDATGHGLKAGSVVTATKSLFNAFAEREDIPQIFNDMSRALKQMNLRGLFMAMTMLKVKDNQVSLSIAGMPSALVYRSDSRTVEEIAIRAMPLGSLSKTKYQEQQITLAENDVVVLMSDGFPEMFNPADEMLGFEKASEILPAVANLSAQEIINRLVKVGEDFANGRAADDDVTFVVLKIGGNLN